MRLVPVTAPGWKHHLDLSRIFIGFDETKHEFSVARDAVVKAIREAPFWDPEDSMLVFDVEMLEQSESLDEFNDHWDDFYDWCDDNRVWVKTAW